MPNCVGCDRKFVQKPFGSGKGRSRRYCVTCRPPRARATCPLGDPVTSDRHYESEEREFLLAVERYKREKRRPFPTLAELLYVLKSLGYRKGT